MTTIAATVYQMAADSGITTSSGIFPSTKLLRTKRGIVGAAGTAAECALVLEWLDDKANKPRLQKASEFAALILGHDGLFYMEADLYPNPVLDGIFAIGSGGPYALGSMRRDVSFGLVPDPRAAVAIGCLCDPNSAEPISFLTLSRD